MSTSLRVLLIAEEAAGQRVLRMLGQAAHEVVAVVTTGETLRGLASRTGCPVWPAGEVKHPGFADTVRGLGVDLLLNVHSLSVLSGDVVAAPRIGSFNLHPGPLPEYAGLNAPSWAIYEGERTHAVTLHWMEAGIDTGDIVYQEKVEILAVDTGFTLSAKCARAGVPLVGRLLEASGKGAGAVPRIPQRGTRRYFGRAVPQNGRLQWDAPAERIVNFVRGSDYRPFRSPWGHPLATVAGQDLAVLEAARTGAPSTEVPGTVRRRSGGAGAEVATRDEWVLIRTVRVDGEDLDAAAVLERGQRFD